LKGCVLRLPDSGDFTGIDKQTKKTGQKAKAPAGYETLPVLLY
jgi:hypothetical protein